MNVGADMRFFDGRIEFNVDYYDKKTSDLLMRVPLPSAAGGYMRVLRNVGEVGNKGFEIYLGGSPVNGELTWETGITFGRNKNEVLALRGDETSYSLGDAGVPGLTILSGLKLDNQWGCLKDIYKMVFGKMLKQQKLQNTVLFLAHLNWLIRTMTER
jgi:hypothetical protein